MSTDLCSCFPCGRSQFGPWCSNPNCPAHRPVEKPEPKREDK